MSQPVHKNKQLQQARIRLIVMAAIVVCVNVLASYFHTGLDLTREQRFTLTEPTKNLLRNMDEVAVVDVYLKGKFPAGLQRLQEGVRERLRSFKEYAGNKLIFRFIDPFEGKTDKEKKQIAHDLQNKGINVMELKTQDDEEFSMKTFFPYALVQYKGREMPIYLLDAPPGRSAEEQINFSEAMLEYTFANAINRLGKAEKPSLAYITGHGEPLGVKTYDMLTRLTGLYTVDTLDITTVVSIPITYSAIIVNQPTQTFSGPDKLKLDQYIMRGGKALWVINAMNASTDSLANSPQFIAMEHQTDLDDMLFKYGVRVNFDLLEDLQCNPLPRVMNGGKPEMHDWVYFPRINPTSQHPVVKNMDLLLASFTNTIDTIKLYGVQKTILLHSSRYSRTARSPVRVSLSMMSYPLRHEMFTRSYLPVAVLLEGEFHSLYEGRLAPEYLRLLDSLKIPFKPKCDSAGAMIITSLGDVFSNGYSSKDGILPMGYYNFTGEFFANRAFLLNALEYLTDKSGILEARSKDVKLRLLDKGRVKAEKGKWQFVNVVIPISIVLVFGSFYLFFRKRRYEVRFTTTKPDKPNA
jgi:gliding-associated putative ABC transporter substrate-binding component GldG